MLIEFNPKATKPCLVETTPFIIGLIWSRSRLERLVWISFWSSTLYLKLLPVDKISCEASSKQRICSFSTSCDHSLPAKLLHCQVLHDAARWKACCQVAWMPSSRECLEDEGVQQFSCCWSCSAGRVPVCTPSACSCYHTLFMLVVLLSR